MPVETLADSDLENIQGPPKIEIIEQANAGEILKIAREKPNLLRNAEEMDCFFKKSLEEKKSELFFSAPCIIKTIHEIRTKALDFLQNSGSLRTEESFEMEQLIGEIVRDTLHSSEQGFADPVFVVKLNNLNDPDKFSFDIINPDKVSCEKWSRFTSQQSIRKVSFDDEIGGSVGQGATLLEGLADSLGAKIWYSDIKNAKGEKEFTFFHFERNRQA